MFFLKFNAIIKFSLTNDGFVDFHIYFPFDSGHNKIHCISWQFTHSCFTFIFFIQRHLNTCCICWWIIHNKVICLNCCFIITSIHFSWQIHLRAIHLSIMLSITLSIAMPLSMSISLLMICQHISQQLCWCFFSNVVPNF